MTLPHVYYAAIYYVSLALFAAAGLIVNGVTVLLWWLPATPRVERFFQGAIHRAFQLFIRWTTFTGVCRVEYRGIDRGSGRRVLVANHPGLMDAPYLIARVPDAVCIFKTAIGRNPVLGAAARRAGYLANTGALHLVRSASEKVAAGATLIVFPEGTRTATGAGVGPFRPGFALIARRARAPIQLVRITCNANLLAKGRPWWKLPQLPARVVVQGGPCLDSTTPVSTQALVETVEAWFRPTSRQVTPAVRNSPAFASSAHPSTAL